MPKVSVIIPTHNSAQYLFETIESVISQSFKDIEIIIVDDCSTDNTQQMMDFCCSDKIRYIRLEQNHGGPSRPRNVGVKAAKSKYIAFCDSDDLLLPNRLDTSVKLLEAHPELGMTFTNELKFDEESGKDIGDFLNGYDVFHSLNKKKSNNSYIIKARDAFSCLFYENYIMPSGVTIPASIFSDVGYFDESITNGDDRDMWFRISRKYPIGYIDCIGFRYRIRVNGISGRGPQLAQNRTKVFQKQIETGLPQYLRKRAFSLIAHNSFEVGYHYQKKGMMKKARKYYLKSLKKSFNLYALKGLFISILSRNLYLRLNNKNKSN